MGGFILFVLLVVVFVCWVVSNTKTTIPKQQSYKDLLNCCEWKQKRNKIMNRDNNRCVYCGTVHFLQVHHTYYNVCPNGEKVNPWAYPDDALITLCDDCHKKVHKNKKIKCYNRSRKQHFE